MNSLSKFRNTKATKKMGMEWEMLLPEEVVEKCLYKHQGFWYLVNDGSIRVPRPGWRSGVECVSQPLTPDWLIKEIYRLTKKIGTPSYNESCGIHIHVNRGWATPKKTEAIVKFVMQLDDEQLKDFFGRSSNNYCLRPSSFTESKTNRYYQINQTNKDTIEFRMFASGRSSWAEYCVRCVKYMLDNAYTLNLDAFYAFRELNQHLIEN